MHLESLWQDLRYAVRLLRLNPGFTAVALLSLGADRGGIVAMVLREAGVLLAIGQGVGIVLALASARTTSALLYGLKPHDPVTLVASIALLAMVAIAASALPAKRAAKLDPMVALREE